MSRPTKYNEEIQELTDKYIDGDWKSFEEGDAIPTVEGLMDYIYTNTDPKVHVVEKTIYNWKDANPAFLQSLERLKRLQKRVLQNETLRNNYNQSIGKVILAVNHGMIEKTATDITSSDGSMKPTSIELIGVIADEQSTATDTE